jgi:hypothetical protein
LFEVKLRVVSDNPDIEFDEAIDRGMSPDYARDFDTLFFQCAHPGLIVPRYLVGNEPLRLTGLMPGEEPFEFQLPCISVVAKLADARGT